MEVRVDNPAADLVFGTILEVVTNAQGGQAYKIKLDRPLQDGTQQVVEDEQFVSRVEDDDEDEDLALEDTTQGLALDGEARKSLKPSQKSLRWVARLAAKSSGKRDPVKDWKAASKSMEQGKTGSYRQEFGEFLGDLTQKLGDVVANFKVEHPEEGWLSSWQDDATRYDFLEKLTEQIARSLELREKLIPVEFPRELMGDDAASQGHHPGEGHAVNLNINHVEFTQSGNALKTIIHESIHALQDEMIEDETIQDTERRHRPMPSLTSAWKGNKAQYFDTGGSSDPDRYQAYKSQPLEEITHAMEGVILDMFRAL